MVTVVQPRSPRRRAWHPHRATESRTGRTDAAGFALAADAGAPTYTAIVDEIEADAFADAAAFRQRQGSLLGPLISTSNNLPALPTNGGYRHSLADSRLP